MKTMYYYIALVVLLLCSCEEQRIGPTSKSKGKPDVVTILRQESIPGGVKVVFRIPESEDILSIKAVYTLSNGKKMEKTASYFDNTLVLEGYADQEEHEVTLYVLNRALESSDPVTIKFTPLEAPFLQVRKTMVITPDFGGARFTWANESKAPLTFDFLAQDSVGNLQPLRIMVSSSETMRFNLRGYEPKERLFAAVVRDNWDNIADTIYQSVVPILEEKMNKSEMKVMMLNNDHRWNSWEGEDAYLIDDNLETIGHSPNNSIPAVFTLDLGRKVQLSRVVLFLRYIYETYYSHGNPRTFNLFGCFGTPSQSGNWSEWTLLHENFEIIKPSGLPGREMADEDLLAGQSGFEFELNGLTDQPLRYLRFVLTSTWDNMSICHLSEVDVFGTYVE